MLRRALLANVLVPLAAAAPRPSAAADTTSCCGPITPAGARLTALLDSMDVEHRWLAHKHVNWETGEQDQTDGFAGPDRATHCSAFAAAVGKRLGIYMLRPPDHPLTFLASAQTYWFEHGDSSTGWQRVADWQTAQRLANEGTLVVMSYYNPSPQRSGHIVIVRPSLKSSAALASEGPQVIQAAGYNRASAPAATSFSFHPGAWPSQVKIFAHPLPAAS